jgi:hypothetical protein
MFETYMTLIKEDGIYIIKKFKVQEGTTYHPMNNNLKIVFEFSTSVKEVKQSSIKYPRFFLNL